MVEFKVGDRVKWRGFDSWQNCTIQRMDDEGAFVVGNDNEGEGYLYFTSIDLIKPEPTPIPAEIAERMRGLIERMAGRDYLTDLNTEAKAIMEVLKPVDPDIAEALAIVKQHYPEMKPDYRGRRYEIAIAAIAKGRLLERGGE